MSPLTTLAHELGHAFSYLSSGAIKVVLRDADDHLMVQPVPYPADINNAEHTWTAAVAGTVSLLCEKGAPHEAASLPALSFGQLVFQLADHNACSAEDLETLQRHPMADYLDAIEAGRRIGFALALIEGAAEKAQALQDDLEAGAGYLIDESTFAAITAGEFPEMARLQPAA